MISNSVIANMKNCCLLSMMAALIGLLANMSPVFAMQLEHLSEGDGKGLYNYCRSC
jgi:hypothetical protein